MFARRAADRGIDLDTLPLETGEEETPAVEALAGRIGEADAPRDVTGLPLEGLAARMSLNAVPEALSIGGARLFLRSSTGNPFDEHIQTGVNARVNFERVVRG